MQGQTKLPHVQVLASYFEIACDVGRAYSPYEELFKYSLLYLKGALKDLQRCSVCDLAKKNFTSKFSYVLFCNLTNKTETWRENRWGTTNNKPPGPIIMLGQSETMSSSQIIFITLFFSEVHSAAEPFTSHGNVRNYAEPKPFSSVKPTYVGFSLSRFTVQDHILSPAGDALTKV